MKSKEVIDHMVKWLDDYCEKTGLNGFVVGISGGIDSAVTSALCAMTGRKLCCLTMPIHQVESEFIRGEEHIDWLLTNFQNVEKQIIDLTSTYDTFQASLPKDAITHLSMANARARIRMTALYTVAGGHGLLVAGTGNKVEDFGIGFFTKYGDGGVDISPIADLNKSEVYAIAKELGVANSIQVASPTDGLWEDGRDDEAQIGASYPELEIAMEQYDAGLTSEDLEGREREVFIIYKRRHIANLHKMVPIPVCTIPTELK